MIKEIKRFQLFCDGCKDQYVDQVQFGLSNSSDSIEEDANQDGWHITEKGKHFCPKCHYVRDDNTLIIKSTDK